MQMSPGIGVMDILMWGQVYMCSQIKKKNQGQKKVKKLKMKNREMEENVKEGDCGLTEGSLEGELQFMFVMERGYAKC